MADIRTLMIIIFVLASVYGKNNVKVKLVRATEQLENPIKPRKGSSVFKSAFETTSGNNSSDKNISHTRHRRDSGFPRNEVILSISNTKTYEGDKVILTAETLCMSTANMYECGGRAPEMNFYQKDVKIANLYIGFADLNCHLRNPNGTQHECSREECNCFIPERHMYIFEYFFKATLDQNGASFIAISRWNLTSNTVHLYVSDIPWNDVILQISGTKVYEGDEVVLTAKIHCKHNANISECGRLPEMNLYQDDFKIATLNIGDVLGNCSLRYSNGTSELCRTDSGCTCFKQEANVYVFKYFFKATPDHKVVTFVAVLGTYLTSNKVHLYVPVGGAVFTRWGNDSCGSIYNEIVFSGYSNYLFHDDSQLGQPCIPERNTAFRPPIVGRKRKRSVRSQNAIVSPNTDPCAVCRSRRSFSVVMVPGRSSCYGDMNLEYNGYLIPGSSNNAVCLDTARAAKISTTRFVNVMKTVCHGDGHCGTSLNVGPIECVVCSI